MAAQLSAKMSIDVSGYEKGISEAKQSTEQYKTQLGDLSKSFPSMRKELVQTKKAIQDMENAWRSMSDAQKKSFEGQQLYKQLTQLKTRGADLVDTLGDINAELRNMASDTKALDIAKQGFDVLGNTVSLAANAYATFTGDNEDAKRALTIFASVQSTVNTLTALQNALQKQSSLMLGITTLQQKAKTKAMELDTVATEGNIVATKGATAAQWALNLAADANPYILLLSAIVALVGGYVMFQDEVNSLIGIQSDLEKEQQAIDDEFKNQTKTLGETQVKVTSLQNEWKALKTEAEKKQWINDNKDAFKDLGVEVNTVEQAENLLVKNTAAFLEAQQLRAEALAYTAVAASKYQKAIENKEMADEQDIAWYEGAFTQLKQFAQGKYVQTFDQIKHSKGKAMYDAALEAEEQANEYVRKAYERNQQADKKLKAASIVETKKDDKKGNKSGTKTDKSNPDKDKLDAQAGSLSALENQLSELQEKYKKGLLPNLNADEYKHKVAELEEQIKDKKIELGLIMPTNTLQGINDEISDLQNKLNYLPVDSAEFDELLRKIQSLKQQKIEIEAHINKDKLVSDINKIADEALKVTDDKKQWDFSGLPKEVAKQAEEAKKELEKIEQAKQKLENIVINVNGEFSTVEIEAATEALSRLGDKYDELTSKVETYNDAASQQREQQKTQEKIVDGWNNVSNALSTTAGAMKQLGEDNAAMTIQFMANAAQMVAQIAKLIPAKQAEAMGNAIAEGTKAPWPIQIATIASLVGTVIATFASLPKFASGGVITGPYATGDRLLVRANAGERILTAKQNNALENALDSNSLNGEVKVQLGVSKVRGQEMFLAVKNYMKVSGAKW